MFIDIHSHLEACKNLPVLFEEAEKKDVKIILSCGVDKKTNRETLEIAKQHPSVKVCLGVYPSDALKLSEESFEQELEFIRENKNKIVAVGEVGLDLHENNESTLEKQLDNLEKLFKLTVEINKPVIVHTRKVEKQAVKALEEFSKKYNFNKILVHCFSGNMKLVKRVKDNGWYFSIPAIVKFSEHFQKMVELIPVENLFCETDSPFLHPDKEPENTPANVIEGYKKIAEIKELSLTDVEKHIEKNYNKLFNQ